jgi:RNA polymerase sigma-70 factor (ECF subfamily)
MSNQDQKLLAVFVEQRDALTRFLARRLGNGAAAEDLAQEAWLRIADGGGATIANPRAYLFRIAANLAIDHQRREQRRRLSAAEIEALLDMPDDAPDAVSAVVARDELAILRQALAELPVRRRAIFLAARLGNQTHREIADRHGLSTRAVEVNVQRALEHCADRLGKRLIPRFGPRSPGASQEA